MRSKGLEGVGSSLQFDYNDFGVVGGMPYAVVGPAAGAAWTFGGHMKAFALQNLSGDWIEISEDNTAANGFRIPHGIALAFDFAETWNGTIYAVNSGAGAVNCIMAICFME